MLQRRACLWNARGCKESSRRAREYCLCIAIILQRDDDGRRETSGRLGTSIRGFAPHAIWPCLVAHSPRPPSPSSQDVVSFKTANLVTRRLTQFSSPCRCTSTTCRERPRDQARLASRALRCQQQVRLDSRLRLRMNLVFLFRKQRLTIFSCSFPFDAGL